MFVHEVCGVANQGTVIRPEYMTCLDSLTPFPSHSQSPDFQTKPLKIECPT